MTSKRCVPVESTLGWSAAASCVCKLIPLFPLIVCPVRAVRKFYCGPIVS